MRLRTISVTVSLAFNVPTPTDKVMLANLWSYVRISARFLQRLLEAELVSSIDELHDILQVSPYNQYSLRILRIFQCAIIVIPPEFL